VEDAAVINIGAQIALTAMPVKVEPLRFSPVGALRHSGWLRVANDGAVRVGLEAGEGLVQMPPAQFPGDGGQAFAQVFAYRFPSEQRSYVISADQIAPETSVNEVTVYELAETDRHMTSDIELDIREAPLTELLVDFPADHAVAAVTGAQVADYAVAGEVKDGMRTLKILFKQPVGDRQLAELAQCDVGMFGGVRVRTSDGRTWFGQCASRVWFGACPTEWVRCHGQDGKNLWDVHGPDPSPEPDRCIDCGRTSDEAGDPYLVVCCECLEGEDGPRCRACGLIHDVIHMPECVGWPGHRCHAQGGPFAECADRPEESAGCCYRRPR
jgi:hypothetical protein